MAWTTPKTWSVGETLTAANFNTHIRDNQLAMAPHLIARKTSDQSISSTSLTNDTQLLTPSIAANEAWQLEWQLVFVTTSNDPNVAVTFPSGTFSGMITGVQNNYLLSGTGTVTNTQSSLDINNNAAGFVSRIHATFVNGATPGAVTLQWCSRSGVTVILKTHSTLWGVKLA